MNSSKSELDFSGWCRGIHRQWSLPGDHNSRQIVGDFILQKPVELRRGDTKYRFRRGMVSIRPSDSGKSRLWFPVHGVSAFEIDVDEMGMAVGQLIVALPHEEFGSVWGQLSRTAVANLYGIFLGSSDAEPINLNDSASLDVVNVRWNFSEKSSTPDWCNEAIASDLRDALSMRHFGDYSRYGVASIVADLCKSSSTAVADESESYAAIIDLLAGIRSAFREPLLIFGNNWKSAWDLAPAEFLKSISDRDEDYINEYRQKYDSLWQHFNVQWVMSRGESKYGALAEGLQPKVGALENIAAKLLASPHVYSSYLEWALIDALIYAECIAFAQQISSNRTELGTLIGTSQASGWKEFVKLTLRRVGEVILEVLIVGVTFGAALALSKGVEHTAWVITTGVTVARWIRTVLLSQKQAPETLATELLQKMAGAHELLKTTDFNARAVRQALYVVSADGAAFSPWVYHLLDARIRRDESGAVSHTIRPG